MLLKPWFRDLRAEVQMIAASSGCKHPRIAVGISGGVDSAVAAWALKEAGAEVVGVHMQNWSDEEERATARYAIPTACSGQDDLISARRVCDHLGIPLETVRFEQEYWNDVFEPLLDGYRAGRTPNPDVLCNRHVKFDRYLALAHGRIQAHATATGHYARTLRPNGSSVPHLLCGVDPVKDQSYFLCMLRPESLATALFPLGALPKRDVRSLATSIGLPNATRPDSMGVCFIGKRSFADFLLNYLEESPGPIHVLDHPQNSLGTHRGLYTYTIGQRVRLPGLASAYYVCRKDIASNAVVVAPSWSHPSLFCAELHTGPVSWLDSPEKIFASPTEPIRIQYRLHHPSSHRSGKLYLLENNQTRLVFDEPERAVAPGQVCAYYLGDRCLGGAFIDSPGLSYHELGLSVPDLSCE